jgi:4-hydroxy-tetrahydrodipicolinate synthase
MIHAALAHDVLSVLWHPPFYYKNLPDDGIIAFYKECLERVNALTSTNKCLKVVLYNFPTLTGVELTHNIVAQLYSLFPSNIMGIKDSGCNFEHTLAYVERFPQLKIYAGKDTDTSELVRRGAAGGIGSLANFIPKLMRSLYEFGKDETKANRNEEINNLVPIINKHWAICSMKALMGVLTNNKQWNVARPPFYTLSWEQGEELVRLMKEARINK